MRVVTVKLFTAQTNWRVREKRSSRNMAADGGLGMGAMELGHRWL